MKKSWFLLLLLAWKITPVPQAAPVVRSLEEVVSVFVDQEVRISVVIDNTVGEAHSGIVQSRLFQANSATAVPLGPRTDWKSLSVQPGQKLLEGITLKLPAVRTPTVFLAHCYSGETKVGVIHVRGYPRDWFSFRKEAEGGIGVLDPKKRLQEYLRTHSVSPTELTTLADDFDGKLIIAGPFQSAAELPENFNENLSQAVTRGKAIVLIVDPKLLSQDALPITSYSTGSGRLVVATTNLIRNVENSPEAQETLLRLVRSVLSSDSNNFSRFKLKL